MKSGELNGAQVDWGAWVAKVTKRQLMDFAESWYQRHPDEQARSDCLQKLESLKDGRIYGLVAMET